MHDCSGSVKLLISTGLKKQYWVNVFQSYLFLTGIFWCCQSLVYTVTLVCFLAIEKTFMALKYLSDVYQVIIHHFFMWINQKILPFPDLVGGSDLSPTGDEVEPTMRQVLFAFLTVITWAVAVMSLSSPFIVIIPADFNVQPY